MVVVSIKLAVLGDISLGIWVVILSRPSGCVTHSFHYCYTFDELYIEVILKNLSSVSLGGWAFIGPHGWPIKRMEVVVCGFVTRRGRVGLNRA